MKVTVLDIVTGEARTRRFGVDGRAEPFWWAEGDGACDCNRRELFFPEHEPPTEEGICEGCYRYVVVGFDPLPRPWALDELNEGYVFDGRGVRALGDRVAVGDAREGFPREGA